MVSNILYHTNYKSWYRSKEIDTTRRTYLLLMNNRYHSFREHFRLRNFNFLPLQFMINQYRLVSVTCNVICKISVNIVAMYKKKTISRKSTKWYWHVTLEWKLLYIGVNKRSVYVLYVAYPYNWVDAIQFFNVIQIRNARVYVSISISWTKNWICCNSFLQSRI